jgi:hypothetical protein
MNRSYVAGELRQELSGLDVPQVQGAALPDGDQTPPIGQGDGAAGYFGRIDEAHFARLLGPTLLILILLGDGDYFIHLTAKPLTPNCTWNLKQVQGSVLRQPGDGGGAGGRSR